MKFKIEVDIDWVGGGSHYDEDGDYISNEMSVDDHVKNKIVEDISTKISSSIEKQIIESVKTKINYSIDQLINDTLSNFLDRQIKITDNYGSIKQTYEDVDEMLKEKFDEFILERVDSKGTPTTTCSYGSKDNSRISYLLERKVAEYKKEFDRNIDKKAYALSKEVYSKIVDEMNSKLTNELAEKIKQIVK